MTTTTAATTAKTTTTTATTAKTTTTTATTTKTTTTTTTPTTTTKTTTLSAAASSFKCGVKKSGTKIVGGTPTAVSFENPKYNK